MLEREAPGAPGSKTSSWCLLRVLYPHVNWVHPREPGNEERHEEEGLQWWPPQRHGLFASSLPSNVYTLFFTKMGFTLLFPLVFLKRIWLLNTLCGFAVIVPGISHWLHGLFLIIAAMTLPQGLGCFSIYYCCCRSFEKHCGERGWYPWVCDSWSYRTNVNLWKMCILFCSMCVCVCVHMSAGAHM